MTVTIWLIAGLSTSCKNSFGKISFQEIVMDAEEHLLKMAVQHLGR